MLQESARGCWLLSALASSSCWPSPQQLLSQVGCHLGSSKRLCIAEERARRTVYITLAVTSRRWLFRSPPPPLPPPPCTYGAENLVLTGVGCLQAAGSKQTLSRCSRYGECLRRGRCCVQGELSPRCRQRRIPRRGGCKCWSAQGAPPQNRMCKPTRWLDWKLVQVIPSNTTIRPGLLHREGEIFFTPLFQQIG